MQGKQEHQACANPFAFAAQISCTHRRLFCFIPNNKNGHNFHDHSAASLLKSRSKPSDIAEVKKKKKKTSNGTERFESDEDDHNCGKRYEELAALVESLKECSRKKDLHKGTQIHVDIIDTGLVEKNMYVGSALVSLYMKCGKLENAQEIFDKISNRDAVCWTALIAGYAQNGYAEKALECFESMKRAGFVPNVVTYVCILKACGHSIGAFEKGQEVHAEIVGGGFLDRNSFIGNALVDMYIKLGKLDKAREVFDTLQVRDTVTWTVLIAGYTQYGYGEEAVECFQMMMEDGFSPDATTFVCILKACGRMEVVKGQEIHAQIVEEGWLGKDVLVGNALVDMYAKSGRIEQAQMVFNELCVRDIVSWNALISGYVQHGKGAEVIDCFEQMKNDLISPDVVTYVCTLKACGSTRMIEKGKEIHTEIVKGQFLEKYVLLGNALVDMYVKFCDMERAQNVFDGLHLRDVVTWNTLIAGYAQHGHNEKSLHCFEYMQNEGVCPNAFTFASILKACANIGEADKGLFIHAMIASEALIGKDTFIGNALVDFYAKCRLIAKAKAVFDELPDRDVISWTTLIGGYAEHGYVENALNCFQSMQHQGVCPNEVTFIYILKACGSVGATRKAEEMYASIDRKRAEMVGNALVDMYAKCGSIEKAQKIFEELHVTRDVVSWNALIAGYSLLGKDRIVFDLFKKMSQEGIKPNVISFVIMLNTCSHSGLVHYGQMCFEAMHLDHGIMPTSEHENCMIDLFGRAGHFDKVLSIIEDMASPMDVTRWHIVLGACQKWGDVRIGRFAFERAKQMEEDDGAAYALMSNIYAAAHIRENVVKNKQ